jgi:DNA-directed RNA polymerase
MDLVQEQKLLERDCIQRGAQRYFETLEASRKRSRDLDGSVVSGLIRDPLHELDKSVRKLQATARVRLLEAQTTGQRLGGWEMPVLTLDSKALAFITFKTVMVAGRDEHRVQRAASTVGRMLNYEVQWNDLRDGERAAAKERDYEPPNRIELLKRTVTEINPRSLRVWLKKLDDIVTTPWSKKIHFVVGSALVAAMLEACPEVVEKHHVFIERMGKRLDRTTIKLHPKFVAELTTNHEREAINSPWLLPMLCLPREWHHSGIRFEGGYYAFAPMEGSHGAPGNLIKEFRYKHTQGDLQNVSPEILQALNRVQSTRWKINTSVLARALTAVEHNVGALPYDAPMDMPENVSAETWAKMTKAERSTIKAKREAVHTHNNRNEAKSLSARRVLNVSQEFAEREAIYFPHSIDWRRPTTSPRACSRSPRASSLVRLVCNGWPFTWRTPSAWIRSTDRDKPTGSMRTKRKSST